MAQQQKVRGMTTEELRHRLVMCRFWQDYYRGGKHPQFWVELISVIEKELHRRGALS